MFGTEAKRRGMTALMGLALLAVMAGTVRAQGKGSLRIVVEPASAMLTVGDTCQFTARLVDRQGVAVDTSITWGVDATGFGEISETGLFTALTLGHGKVYATAGSLIGEAHVNVCDCDSTGTGGGRPAWSHLEILPKDTLLVLDAGVQYRAQLIDSLGVARDTVATWELRGNSVGTLDENGFFTATDAGVGLIRATLERYVATTRVLVAVEKDTASQDTVRIRFRDRDGALTGNMIQVGDSRIFLINGLPFPFNMLNGGEIVFPPGSLEENIDIDIGLTDAAIVKSDSTLDYTDQILNGIHFNVLVDGEVVSPYYFTTPVQLVLPYKEDLLAALGLTPEDLWIFFYENAQDFNGDGITNIVVDTLMNKIYADVIHFSDLVIASKSSVSTAVGDDGGTLLPVQHRLKANYPNPFNPETVIAYQLAGSQSVPVTLTVYDVRGRKVRQLVDGLQAPGTHEVVFDGCDGDGGGLPSGLYIYRLKAGPTVISRRMILMK